jgi:hypothetical protein
MPPVIPPEDAAAAAGSAVKVASVPGASGWHSQDGEDEMFLILAGNAVTERTRSLGGQRAGG